MDDPVRHFRFGIVLPRRREGGGAQLGGYIYGTPRGAGVRLRHAVNE